MVFKLPKKLTPEQSFILNIPFNKNCIIEGGPGTGKTVMAIFRAMQIAKELKDSNDSRKILVLAYNNPLCKYIRTELSLSKYDNLEVSTVSSFLHVKELPPAEDLIFDVTSFANGHHKKIIDPSAFSCEENTVAIATNRNPQKRRVAVHGKYKHIIIDEAQDLPQGYFKAMSKITENISCFVDSQQITRRGSYSTADTIAKELKVVPQTLDENLRNTKEINDAALLFCKDETDLFAERSGRKPIVYECTDLDEQVWKMADVIDRNPKASIGIIMYNKIPLPAKLCQMLYSATLCDRNIEVFFWHKEYDPLDFTTDSIKILSYGTMKGLEFDIVLLPNFNQIPSQGKEIDNANIYVAMTRAKKELHIFYDHYNSKTEMVNTITVLQKNKKYFEWR